MRKLRAEVGVRLPLATVRQSRVGLTLNWAGMTALFFCSLSRLRERVGVRAVFGNGANAFLNCGFLRAATRKRL